MKKPKKQSDANTFELITHYENETSKDKEVEQNTLEWIEYILKKYASSASKKSRE